MAQPAIARSLLRIQLLGDVVVELDGHPVADFASARLQRLLAWLVLHADRAQRRAGLAFTFWPDSTESQARTNLRHLLHDFRQAVPVLDQFVEITPAALSWRSDSGALVDVVEFSAAIDRAARAADLGGARVALEEAVEHYGGAFLPALYDDWVLAERERLQREAVDALYRLGDLTEDAGDTDAALGYARLLLSHDDLHEATYRRLMRLHAARGELPDALRAYHDCVGILSRELDVGPNDETSALYETLKSDAAGPPGGGPSRDGAVGSTLVGRDSERSVALAAWSDACSGRARLLLITGEPGIGKTRLVEELVAVASSEGLPVAMARSYAAEGRLAWGPVVEWLRSEAVMPRLAGLDDVWLREITRFLPELRATRPGLGSPRPVSAADERRHIFDALAHAIRLVDTPLLLVLDDLQWCDADTLEFVHFLVRTEPSACLLVAGTARTEEVGPDHPLALLRASLLANGSETEIALQPLAEDDVLVLATDLAGGELDRAAADRLYRHTEGNPLFVVEAVRAGHAATDVVWLTPTVRAVITSRLSRLSDEARRVTEMAATVGRSFPAEVLRHACQADDRLLDVLDELWARRIIRDVPGGYDFSHDLLREVAYDGISPARRRHLHAAVADALLAVHAGDLGPVSASLAIHYEQAGLVREAVEAFGRAAEHAYVVFAIDDAIAYLRRAMALLDRLPSARARDELEMELCTALGPPYVARAGYGAPEVQATYGRAVQLARRLGRSPSAPVLRGLAIAAIGDCEFARTTELGHELLEQSGDDPLALVEGHYVLGVSAFWYGELDGARDNLEKAIAEYRPELAREHLAHFAQDPRAVCSIRLAYTQWHLGHPALARITAATALELAEALAHPTTLGYVLNYGALLAGELGDEAWLRELVAAGAEVWLPGRLGFFEPQLPLFQGWLEVMAGDAAGIDRIREGVVGCRTPGRTVHLTHALATLAGAALGLGDTSEARAAVAEGLAWTDAHDQRYLEPELHRLDGEVLAAQGDVEAARSALTRATELARARGARSLELRAACSLARHPGGEGELTRLAEVRGVFGADDDSSDLRDADALLAALT